MCQLARPPPLTPRRCWPPCHVLSPYTVHAQVPYETGQGESLKTIEHVGRVHMFVKINHPGSGEEQLPPPLRFAIVDFLDFLSPVVPHRVLRARERVKQHAGRGRAGQQPRAAGHASDDWPVLLPHIRSKLVRAKPKQPPQQQQQRGQGKQAAQQGQVKPEMYFMPYTNVGWDVNA